VADGTADGFLRLHLTPVPEPATAVLAAAGAIVLFPRKRATR
jgi:hypothetical protein